MMSQIRIPALRTGYAEAREARPLVAVVDNFQAPPNEIPHGEIVESVMLTHGKLMPEEIQRLHGDGGGPFAPDEVVQAPPEKTLETFEIFAIGSTGGFYNQASDNLRLIMDELPSVRVVNQSQSENTARLVEPFLQPLVEQPDFRSRLARGLELAPEAPAEQVITSLLAHTDGLLTQDELILEAKQRYDATSKEAFDKGIVHVVAGGNQGELSRQLRGMGVVCGPQTFHSVLVNDYVTVVGAATADGQIATLNSPNAGVEVYAQGEKVPFRFRGHVLQTDGTSVAAPLISSQAAATFKAHPEWTPAQVEQDMLEGR